MENRKELFDKFAEEQGFDPLDPEKWYLVATTAAKSVPGVIYFFSFSLLHLFYLFSSFLLFVCRALQQWGTMVATYPRLYCMLILALAWMLKNSLKVNIALFEITITMIHFGTS